MPFVSVNNIRLYYEIRGTGDPLVLIPGWGREISALDDLIGDLSKKYQVIAVDNRGAGRSDKPDKPYSIEEMGEDLIGLLDALAVEKATLFAMSLGSMIAQVVAAKHPDRVHALIIHVGFTRITLPVKIMMTLLHLVPGSRKKLNGGMKTLMDQKYPPTPESFRRQGEAGTRFDGRMYLGEIRAPTIVINGKRDPFAGEKMARELKRGIAGAEVILIDGDHSIWMNQRDLLVSEIFRFMEQKTGSPDER